MIPRYRNGQHHGKTSILRGDGQDHTLAEKQLLVVLNILHCYLWFDTTSAHHSGGQRAKYIGSLEALQTLAFCSGSHDVLFVLKLLRGLKKIKKMTCRRKRHTVGPKVALTTAFELFIETCQKVYAPQ